MFPPSPFPLQSPSDDEAGEISPEEMQALLDRLNANHRDLLAAILAPKRVVRDAQGRVAGVETL